MRVLKLTLKATLLLTLLPLGQIQAMERSTISFSEQLSSAATKQETTPRVFINYFDYLPPEKVLENLEHSFSSLLPRLKIPYVDPATKEYTDACFMKRLNDIIQELAPGAIVYISGGVVRSPFGYIYKKNRDAHMKFLQTVDANPTPEQIADLVQKTFDKLIFCDEFSKQLTSLNVLGIGSDMDFLIKFPPNFTGDRNDVMRVAKNFINSAETYLGLFKNQSVIKKSIVPVADVKDYDEQLGGMGGQCAVKQGGSSLDWLCFPISPLEPQKFVMPSDHQDILLKFIKGQLQYVKPVEGVHVDQKQVIRFFRALVELCFLMVDEESYPIAKDALMELLQTAKYRSLDPKTLEQLEKLVRNGRYGCAQNRFAGPVGSMPDGELRDLMMTLSEIVKNQTGAIYPIIPEFLPHKKIALRRDDKGNLAVEGFLKPVDVFKQENTDDGKTHHGTPNINNLPPIVRNGPYVSHETQGNAYFGYGTYTSKDPAVAKDYAKDTGVVLTFPVNIHPNLRIVDMNTPKGKELVEIIKEKHPGKEVNRILGDLYDIDIIVNDHVILLNSDAIKIPKNPAALIRAQLDVIDQELINQIEEAEVNNCYNPLLDMDKWLEYTHPLLGYTQFMRSMEATYLSKGFEHLNQLLGTVIKSEKNKRAFETALYVLNKGKEFWDFDDSSRQNYEISLQGLKKYILEEGKIFATRFDKEFDDVKAQAIFDFIGNLNGWNTSNDVDSILRNLLSLEDELFDFISTHIFDEKIEVKNIYGFFGRFTSCVRHFKECGKGFAELKEFYHVYLDYIMLISDFNYQDVPFFKENSDYLKDPDVFLKTLRCLNHLLRLHPTESRHELLRSILHTKPWVTLATCKLIETLQPYYSNTQRFHLQSLILYYKKELNNESPEIITLKVMGDAGYDFDSCNLQDIVSKLFGYPLDANGNKVLDVLIRGDFFTLQQITQIIESIQGLKNPKALLSALALHSKNPVFTMKSSNTYYVSWEDQRTLRVNFFTNMEILGLIAEREDLSSEKKEALALQVTDLLRENKQDSVQNILRKTIPTLSLENLNLFLTKLSQLRQYSVKADDLKEALECLNIASSSLAALTFICRYCETYGVNLSDYGVRNILEHMKKYIISDILYQNLNFLLDNSVNLKGVNFSTLVDKFSRKELTQSIVRFLSVLNPREGFWWTTSHNDLDNIKNHENAIQWIKLFQSLAFSSDSFASQSLAKSMEASVYTDEKADLFKRLHGMNPLHVHFLHEAIEAIERLKNPQMTLDIYEELLKRGLIQPNQFTPTHCFKSIDKQGLTLENLHLLKCLKDCGMVKDCIANGLQQTLKLLSKCSTIKDPHRFVKTITELKEKQIVDHLSLEDILKIILLLDQLPDMDVVVQNLQKVSDDYDPLDQSNLKRVLQLMVDNKTIDFGKMKNFNAFCKKIHCLPLEEREWLGGTDKKNYYSQYHQSVLLKLYLKYDITPDQLEKSKRAAQLFSYGYHIRLLEMILENPFIEDSLIELVAKLKKELSTPQFSTDSGFIQLIQSCLTHPTLRLALETRPEIALQARNLCLLLNKNTTFSSGNDMYALIPILETLVSVEHLDKFFELSQDVFTIISDRYRQVLTHQNKYAILNFIARSSQPIELLGQLKETDNLWKSLFPILLEAADIPAESKEVTQEILDYKQDPSLKCRLFMKMMEMKLPSDVLKDVANSIKGTQKPSELINFVLNERLTMILRDMNSSERMDFFNVYWPFLEKLIPGNSHRLPYDMYRRMEIDENDFDVLENKLLALSKEKRLQVLETMNQLKADEIWDYL